MTSTMTFSHAFEESSVESTIMSLGCQTVLRLGLPKLLHRTILRNQLTILMYHAIVLKPLAVRDWCFLNISSFINQIQYLQKNFQIIPLSDAVKRMKNGGISRPTAVVTFDDGFQSNYDLAFPILRDAGIPATIFLATGLVNTDDTVWFCRLNQALTKTKKLALEWNGYISDFSVVLF
jgi:polysaccharide deacetylase